MINTIADKNTDLKTLMHEDMYKLDQVIRTDLSSNIVLIRQIREYIIAAGGKRVRPLLTLLCGRICGYADGDVLHKMAAMIEYIHTATLLHDDVVDESGMRRGRQTANAVFGNAASVLVGDFIYTRAFQMMLHGNSLRLMQIMADCTNQVSEGEVLQLLNIGNSNLTEKDYLQVIEAKTAALFEASARVAAIVSNATTEQEAALVTYAVKLGTAFQIIDDILDYSGAPETLGKNVGDDLLEGKVTLPLIYLLQNAKGDNLDSIKNAINQPKSADIQSIIDIVTSSQALKYCKDLAHTQILQATTSLDIFASSSYKDAMVELATSSLSRIY